MYPIQKTGTPVNKQKREETGTVLIALIFVMIAVAAIGLITLSVNTISTYSQMNVNNFNKAYYLAESGCRCFRKGIFPMPYTSNDYTLTDGGKISVKKEGMKTFSIKGIVNQGTIFEAARKIYCIDSPSCVNTLSVCNNNTFISKGLSYWNFDDNSDPGNDSWDGNHATLNGALSWSDVLEEKGIVNSALEFDGSDDYLYTPFKPNVIVDNNPFTIMFWAKPNSSGKQTILGTSAGTNNLSVGIDSGNWYWEYGDKFSVTIPELLSVSNQWQHITLVYTGIPDQKMILYVNGEQSASYDYGTSGGNAAMPGTDLFIGAKNDNGSGDIEYFNGFLDELAIYNRALDYNEIKRVVCINGLSYWNFNDEYNPGKDYWGGKNAVLNGAASWTDIWQNDFTNCLTEFEGVDGFLEFDGTNVYLSAQFKPNVIKDDKPFTVLLWAKPTNLGTPQTLLGTTDGTNHFSIGINVSDKWYWEYGDKSSDTSISGVNNWQHIALVYTGDSGNMITYFNASQSVSYDYGTSGGNAAMPNQYLFIGAKNNNGTGAVEHFKGFLDETAIYDRALTVCEIREFYNAVCHAGCEAVAYYPFNCNADDESGWCRSGNGNKGEVNGAVLTGDRFSCIERAYQFDGTDDYIHVSDNDTLDLSTEGTLAAWIYINDYRELGGIIHKGDKGNFTDEAYSLQFWFGESGNGKKKIIFALLEEPAVLRSLVSDILLNLHEWYYVAGTWDKDGMYLYIIDKNNLLTYKENTSVKNISARNTSGGLNIGSQLGSGSYGGYGNCPFNGVIDDVVVSNKRFSEDEIKELAYDHP